MLCCKSIPAFHTSTMYGGRRRALQQFSCRYTFKNDIFFRPHTSFLFEHGFERKLMLVQNVWRWIGRSHRFLFVQIHVLFLFISTFSPFFFCTFVFFFIFIFCCISLNDRFFWRTHFFWCVLWPSWPFWRLKRWWRIQTIWMVLIPALYFIGSCLCDMSWFTMKSNEITIVYVAY